METKKICVRCGAELQKPNEPFYDQDGMDEGVLTEEYQCPNCGAYHTMFIHTEEDEYDENAPVLSSYHGYPGECFRCGANLIWSSDFMRSEVWGDVDENNWEEDDSLATYCTCPHCGAMIEIVDVKYKDEMKYPYYQERYKARENAEKEEN